MPRMAYANLRPFNNSGISATVRFFQSDDGQFLTVSGTVAGMSPFAQYLFLVYGPDSHADVDPPFPRVPAPTTAPSV